MASSIGSSLDTQALVSAMMRPYEAKVATYNKTISSYNVQISDLGKIKSSFDQLKTDLANVEGNQTSPLTTDKIKESLQKFVTDYNAANTLAKKSNDYSIKRDFQRIRSDLDPAVYSKLGLSFDKSGTLSLKESTFDTLATNDVTALNTYVNTIFDKALESTSSLNRMVSFNGTLDYKEDLLKAKAQKITDQRDDLSDKMVTYQAKYANQFNNLQQMLDKMSVSENTITNLMTSFNSSNK